MVKWDGGEARCFIGQSGVYVERLCMACEVNKAWMMEAGEESDGRCTWV